jgi:hypothetical protein
MGLNSEEYLQLGLVGASHSADHKGDVELDCAELLLSKNPPTAQEFLDKINDAVVRFNLIVSSALDKRERAYKEKK